MDNFKDRLRIFRVKKGFDSKKQFARILGVHENSYYMVENGTRRASKEFMRKLVSYSNKPEEYWLYGIEPNSDKKEIYFSKEFKILNNVTEEILDDFKKTNILTEDQKQLILAAYIAGLKHIIRKEQDN